MRSTDLHFANLRIFRELLYPALLINQMKEWEYMDNSGNLGKMSSLSRNEAETGPEYFGLYRDIAKFAL